MKLGFNSAILPDLSFEQVINMAAYHSFACVEVMCWPKGEADRRYAGITHIDMETLSKTKVDEITGYAKDKGVQISALGYYPNPLDADYAKRAVYIAHIKKVIEGAAKLGVDTISTFIGRNPKANIADSMADFKKTWPDIIKFAEDHNVKVAIENCPMLFSMDEWPGGKNLAASPKIWRDMFCVIDSDHFGLNYDPSHLVWQRMNYIKPIYDFKDKIFHTHIKDAKFFADKYDEVGILAVPLEYQVPKIPGYGDIDWSAFFCALSEIRYKSHCVIEVEDYAFEDSLEERKAAILQSKKYISQWI